MQKSIVTFTVHTSEAITEKFNVVSNYVQKWIAKFVIPLVTGKGKAILLHPWTDPEGSRRLRLPDFKTVGT
jgi:hypothetical protein